MIVIRDQLGIEFIVNGNLCKDDPDQQFRIFVIEKRLRESPIKSKTISVYYIFNDFTF